MLTDYVNMKHMKNAIVSKHINHEANKMADARVKTI